MAKNKKEAKTHQGSTNNQKSKCWTINIKQNKYNSKSKELKWTKGQNFTLIKRAIKMSSFDKDYKNFVYFKKL